MGSVTVLREESAQAEPMGIILAAHCLSPSHKLLRQLHERRRHLSGINHNARPPRVLTGRKAKMFGKNKKAAVPGAVARPQNARDQRVVMRETDFRNYPV